MLPNHSTLSRAAQSVGRSLGVKTSPGVKHSIGDIYASTKPVSAGHQSRMGPRRVINPGKLQPLSAYTPTPSHSRTQYLMVRAVATTVRRIPTDHTSGRTCGPSSRHRPVIVGPSSAVLSRQGGPDRFPTSGGWQDAHGTRSGPVGARARRAPTGRADFSRAQ